MLMVTLTIMICIYTLAVLIYLMTLNNQKKGKAVFKVNFSSLKKVLVPLVLGLSCNLAAQAIQVTDIAG